jgi:predicted DNA-binding protein (MmcQ/YjbR family)
MTSPEQTLKKLRALCLSFPEASEASCWGHPNFKAGKKTFVTFERVKGRPSIAFRLDPDDIARLLGRLKAAPTGSRKQFFVTPYGRGQWVSLWADRALDWRAVDDLVERGYRVVALKRMLVSLEAKVRRT